MVAKHQFVRSIEQTNPSMTERDKAGASYIPHNLGINVEEGSWQTGLTSTVRNERYAALLEIGNTRIYASGSGKYKPVHAMPFDKFFEPLDFVLKGTGGGNDQMKIRAAQAVLYADHKIEEKRVGKILLRRREDERDQTRRAFSQPPCRGICRVAGGFGGVHDPRPRAFAHIRVAVQSTGYRAHGEIQTLGQLTNIHAVTFCGTVATLALMSPVLAGPDSQRKRQTAVPIRAARLLSSNAARSARHMVSDAGDPEGTGRTTDPAGRRRCRRIG